MLKLISNELIKFFLRPFTYIFFSLLFVLMFSTFFLAPKVFDYDYGGDRVYSNSWKKEAKNDIINFTSELEKVKNSKNSLNKEVIMKKEFLPIEIRRLSAHLKYNIHPPAPNNVYSKLFNASSFIPVISIFLIVYSSGIVSQEFQYKTIKNLLISPNSRFKILISKYLSVIIVCFVSVFLMYLFMGGISLFTSHLNPTKLFVYYDLNERKMEKILFSKNFAIFILNNFIQLLIISTLSFSLSTILKNSTLSISLSLGFYFLSNLLVDFVDEKYKFIKWLWFSHWDLNNYLGITSSKLVTDISLSFSVTYDVILVLIALSISVYMFCKKDIHV
ncbi:hypothetical protein A9958_13280 (plasmid) [Staphylococcus simulans]|uniref:ABC transporter permease n=1 Tax=Staphylococcus simulans TaxID=1286 RepID=UPI000D0A6866|nr:ABC transporter permease subunit [Staphylococcus simulans]AVO03402.1 hypothetical protein BI282_13275 [Staphylococcus simulans]AVO06335.1 hypothetical protein BI283_13105 [Staphylococcus simulans]AWG19950.1 hypothetical protein A9958_13280 [Staphylococcus simulans]AWI02834.1 hypothetical protein A7X73_12815 [Staphylococcus simulans]